MSALTLHDTSAFFPSFRANWAAFALVFSVHGCFYSIPDPPSLMVAPVHRLYTSALSIKSLRWIFQITWVVFKISVPVFSRTSYAGKAFVWTGFFAPLFKHNTSRHKLKSPVSMNYSVALALNCNASFIQPSNLCPTHLAQKKYQRLYVFFCCFYLFLIKTLKLLPYFNLPPLSWHFISPTFCCLHPHADLGGGSRSGRRGREGPGGVRDGCKCGIM